MTDIVERLKSANGNTNGPHEALLIEAAAEIESLRRQWVEGVTKLLWQVSENKKIIDDATARIDRAGL